MPQKSQRSEIKKARKIAVQNAIKNTDEKNQTLAVVTSDSFETDGYSVPQICLCCLKPTKRKFKLTSANVKKYNSGVRKTTVKNYKSADFYLCQKCADHVSEYKKKSLALLVISLVANTAGMLLVMPIIKNAGLSVFTTGLSHFMAALSGAVLTTLIAGLVCRLNPLAPSHTCWTEFVGFVYRGFRFANFDYAKLFKKANSRYFNSTELSGVEMSYEKTVFDCRFAGRYLPGDITLMASNTFIVFICSSFIALLYTYFHEIDAM